MHSDVDLLVRLIAAARLSLGPLDRTGLDSILSEADRASSARRDQGSLPTCPDWRSGRLGPSPQITEGEGWLAHLPSPRRFRRLRSASDPQRLVLVDCVRPWSPVRTPVPRVPPPVPTGRARFATSGRTKWRPMQRPEKIKPQVSLGSCSLLLVSEGGLEPVDPPRSRPANRSRSFRRARRVPILAGARLG